MSNLTVIKENTHAIEAVDFFDAAKTVLGSKELTERRVRCFVISRKLRGDLLRYLCREVINQPGTSESLW